MIPGSLKVGSEPLDEWILYIVNVDTFDYNTEAWVGEEISKCTWMHQNAKY